MSEQSNASKGAAPAGGEGAGGGRLRILLATSDAALLGAWRAAEAPPDFALETAAEVCPEHFGASGPVLVLVDAAAAEGRAASLLEANAGRCVWVGPGAALERLGPARVEEAYDVLVTPTGRAALGRRLAGWARSIRQTAALEAIGNRVERLAEHNDRLAARIAEVETQAKMLARQRERLDQALGRIRQVARLSREINSLDLEKIIHVCIERLPALVEARRASLYFYDAAGDRLVLQGHTHDYAIAERVDLKANARSPMAVAVRRGELLLIREFREFEQAQDIVLEREFREQYQTHSCIIAPLKGGGRVRGVLNLAEKAGGERFDDEIDLPVVEQIAELIGASIYNVELFREMERRAKTDPLTELANRRALEEALARETDRARRYGSSMSILMIDVDQLKAINDAHGHEAGDAVLKSLAAVLVETVRSVDVPGRWAGDEFLVVLPDTSEAQSARLAKRLLKAVRSQPASLAGKRLESSVSVGVAEYDPKESLDALLRRVDQATYDAKHGGRDRIETAEKSEKSEKS